MSDRPYNPELQSIGHLISLCEADWGDPIANRSMLLPTGLAPLDKAVYGLDTINGEVVLIQGPEKQRKSTLVANILINYMLSPKPAEKPLTVIDTLESGMQPKRYRDLLISMVATQLLFDIGHVHGSFCPQCNAPACKEMGINPEFLRYNSRTATQSEMVKEAMNIISRFALHIYGASNEEGSTRSLAKSVVGTKDLSSRWNYLIDEYGAKVFVTDHIQQYSFEHETVSDYEKQIRTISAVSDIVAAKQVVCLELSQVSLTSQREAVSGTGKYTATGGRKAAAESTSIISVNYESGASDMCITLEDSRKSAPFSMYTNLEPSSGRFFGEVTVGRKSTFRPGMEEGATGQAKYRGNKHTSTN
jgi:hypothetical protein